MTKINPIPKLNKRLIMGCLLALPAVAVPLIVFPMASSSKKAFAQDAKTPVQANLSANDAFVLSGTERFPTSYEELKGFEKEVTQPKDYDEDKLVLEALEHSKKDNNNVPQVEQQPRAPMAYADRDDPWKEAKKREQRQQAFDHYDAKRSDILFINNAKQGDKSPDRASDESSKKNQHDIFFTNASGSKKDQIGKIKEALPFMISEGTLIPAILLSEINTSLPGPILARVSYNIWDSKTGQTLLIPQNSKLIGEYSSNIGNGQIRAQIIWKRIIFPNQQSIDLGAMVGVDKKGISGSSGLVDNHYDKVALGLLLTTALSAGVRMTQGKYDPNSATIGQELGNSVAQETSRLGNKITDKMLSIPPTIKVPMGERLNVFVEQDLSLQPYAG